MASQNFVKAQPFVYDEQREVSRGPKLTLVRRRPCCDS